MLGKKLLVLLILTVFFFIFTGSTFAQQFGLNPNPLEGSHCLVGVDGVDDKVATLDCLPLIIGNIIFWLLLLAGVVALVLIIISGFKFVTSGGEPKKAEGARKTMTYAIIGLVLVLLSFGILRFIARATGVNCINIFGLNQCTPDVTDCISSGNMCGGALGVNCCGASVCRVGSGGGPPEYRCR